MKRYKYPRTFHIPSSPGLSSDDKMIESLDIFKGNEVVITEKMDGESCTFYNDYYHARSIDGRHHPSRDWIKGFHASNIIGNIPDNLHICGENLYAKHSIGYDNLESYFYGFNVWEDDICLSWEDTLEWFELLDITHVPILYRGEYSEEVVKDLEEYVSNNSQRIEGFVIRNVGSFLMEDFQKNVAKYVRKGHVQTDTHWMNSEIIKNGLKNT